MEVGRLLDCSVRVCAGVVFVGSRGLLAVSDRAIAEGIVEAFFCVKYQFLPMEVVQHGRLSEAAILLDM